MKKSAAKNFLSLAMAAVCCFSYFPTGESEILNTYAASNEQIIFDYLTGNMGFNVAISCGILANIEKESSFDPTLYGDGGTSYGICQWHNGRMDNLISYCKNNGYDYKSISGQLHFMEYELIYNPGDTGSIYKTLQSMNNSDNNNGDGAYWAGYYWCYKNERPANKEARSKERGNLARDKYWEKYKPDDSYTVWLNAGGGSVGTGSITVKADGTYSGLPTPSRNGYDFAGWFDEGGRQVSDGTSIYKNSEHTLYAHWNAKSHSVKLDAGGGNVSPESITVYTDGKYSGLPAPSRYGYNFAGWFDDNGRQVSDGAGIYTNGSHTLHAHWNPKAVKVNLNANGGEVSPESIDVYFDGNYNLPSPTREGYNFTGWFTDTEGDTEINFNSVCSTTDEHTLYAHWDKNKIMITFNAMGGTVEKANKLIVYDNKYGILPEPEKKGYAFQGWYLDEEYTAPITSDSTVNITANQEVYAKWELQKYYISFDANGGEVDAEGKEVTSGKKYGILPEPVNGAKKFAGWFTVDGTEVNSSCTVEITEDTTLYARWITTGDINSDGELTADDALILQSYLLGEISLSETEYDTADINSDNSADVFDMIIMRELMGE